MTTHMESKQLKRNKKLLRTIFQVYEKNMKGDTIDELLEGVGQHRPELDEKVDALIELYSHKSREGFLELGNACTRSIDIYEFFREEMKAKMQEEFWTVILDNKHRVIDKMMITLGTLNQSLVHPREVFAAAIEKRAAAIALVHNHPSGDCQPSGQDKAITDRLIKVGELVGIKVLDHVIIGQDKYFSFVDEGIGF